MRLRDKVWVRGQGGGMGWDGMGEGEELGSGLG